MNDGVVVLGIIININASWSECFLGGECVEVEFVIALKG